MEFDYIVVGGGTAGATIAGRLSEDPSITVAVIEAGGEGRGLLSTVPTGILVTTPSTYKAIDNWRFSSVPQAGLNGRRSYCPRGKVLGGSSAINGMAYVRGHRRDYDHWAELGCEGWGWNDVLPYFIKSENNSRGASQFHGADGPAHVTDLISPRPISRAFVEAASVHFGKTDDYNCGDTTGAALFQSSAFHNGPPRGQRCTSAAAFLHPNLSRKNLFVIAKAHVMRLVLEGDRVTSIVYRHDGEDKVMTARREIILSAGTVQSPQILMLSGIGPASHLRDKGIAVRVESPEVGRNYSDHIDQTLIYDVKTSDVIGLSLASFARLIRAVGQWRRDGSGVLGSAAAEATAFYASGPDAQGWPDMQMHFIIAKVLDHGRKLSPGNGVTGHVGLLRPKSRGQVTLATRNPFDAPEIDPAFLSDEADVRMLLDGIHMLRKVFDTPPLKNWITRPLMTEGLQTDAEWIGFMRETADTLYHPVGTCRMGADSLSVVDPRLRVRGVRGLRVADASVMPQITSGNTAAPSMMIGEKVAAMVMEDNRS